MTDRLDEALFALVREPARRDLRARVLARLETATPARPRWAVAAVAATAAAATLVVLAPVARRSLSTTPAPLSAAPPRPARAAAPATGSGPATPVFAAGPAAPVVRAHRVPQPRMETQVTAIETDLAIAPLAAPAAIRIAPIEAERSAITSLASDPLVIPPLDAESVPGQEERP